MSFFDSLKTKMAGLKSDMEIGLKKYKNKNVLNGMMAGCAFVAAADGEIKSEEKQKMANLIRNSSVTDVYDPAEAIKIFTSFAEKFEFDFQVGRNEALLAISKLKGDSGVARLIIRGCIAIGAADGDFDKTEQAVVREICLELGQDPAEFNL
jgi:tellurite resistance protein TerB